MGIHYLPVDHTIAPAETREHMATKHPQERPKWESPGKNIISEPLDILIADRGSQLPGYTISFSAIAVPSEKVKLQ